MLRVIFIYVIIEVIVITITSKARLSRKVHIAPFLFLNCINFCEMAVKIQSLIFFPTKVSKRYRSKGNVSLVSFSTPFNGKPKYYRLTKLKYYVS